MPNVAEAKVGWGVQENFSKVISANAFFWLLKIELYCIFLLIALEYHHQLCGKILLALYLLYLKSMDKVADNVLNFNCPFFKYPVCEGPEEHSTGKNIRQGCPIHLNLPAANKHRPSQWKPDTPHSVRNNLNLRPETRIKP